MNLHLGVETGTSMFFTCVVAKQSSTSLHGWPYVYNQL